MKSFGGFIAKKRKAKGLTQRALGELSGVSFSNIAKIEAGKISPSVNVAERLCKALSEVYEIGGETK